MPNNYFINYPENLDIYLKKIIEDLDIESFDNYIQDGGDISAINLSLIICQYGNADDEIIWDSTRAEDDINLLRSIDNKKATLVATLLKRGILFDEKCLLYCYTFRCPNTAEILLSNGIDPNVDCGLSSSLLEYICTLPC